MNLFEQLRKLGATLPPSHVPTLNELAGIVGAMVAHAEHGDSILQAAEQGAEEVAKALAPAAADVASVLVPEAAPVAQAAAAMVEHLPGPTPPADPEDEVAELKKQLESAQTLIATLQRGRVVASDGGAA